jgi:hypothetical protein
MFKKFLSTFIAVSSLAALLPSTALAGAIPFWASNNSGHLQNTTVSHAMGPIEVLQLELSSYEEPYFLYDDVRIDDMTFYAEGLIGGSDIERLWLANTHTGDVLSQYEYISDGEVHFNGIDFTVPGHSVANISLMLELRDDAVAANTFSFGIAESQDIPYEYSVTGDEFSPLGDFPFEGPLFTISEATGTDLGTAGLDVPTCDSPYVPYGGECEDPIPACLDFPENAVACIDKIHDGIYTYRYNFPCHPDFTTHGLECIPNIEVASERLPDLYINDVHLDAYDDTRRPELMIKFCNGGDAPVEHLSPDAKVVVTNEDGQETYYYIGLSIDTLEPGNCQGQLLAYADDVAIDEPGTYRVSVHIDSSNIINEHQEGNNTINTGVELEPGELPDLYLASLHLEDWLPHLGQKLIIKYCNGGDVAIEYKKPTAGIVVNYPNGESADFERMLLIDNMDPGECFVHSLTSTNDLGMTEPGRYWVGIGLDSTHIIDESNNDNNVRGFSVVIDGDDLPDLQIVDAAYVSNMGPAVMMEVCNNGDGDLGHRFVQQEVLVIDSYGVEARLNTTANIERLDAGQCIGQRLMDIRDTGFTAAGEYDVQVYMDIWDKVEESNESNNKYRFDIVLGDEFTGDEPVDVDLPLAGFEDEVLVDTDAYSNPFPDTDRFSIEGRSAAELYRRGVLGGFPDGEFKGDRDVNRAEAAKFLLLARFGVVADYANNRRFADVLDSQWYTRYVVRAAELGIIEGHPDGLFRPGNSVNTVEFLKMLSLTFDLKLNLPYSYDDVSSEAWYAQYAGIAEQYDLFPNRYDRVLNPGGALTRNEVAVAIYQYLSNR